MPRLLLLPDFLLLLLLYFLLDEHALANSNFESECNDEGIHFVELAGIWPVDHAVAEEFDSLLEVVVEGRVDYLLVAGLGGVYKRKKKTMRISS